MRIVVFIGPSVQSCAALNNLFKTQADLLRAHRVLVPAWKHDSLYHAVAEADRISLDRVIRGSDTHDGQTGARDQVRHRLNATLRDADADIVILNAAQLGGLLCHKAEVQRLYDLLAPFAEDIRIVAHVDEQARMLAAHYGHQIMRGRRHSLDQELALLSGGSWWDDALALQQTAAPLFGLFNEVQHPPHWLDYGRLVSLWETAFGAGRVHLEPLCHGQDRPHICTADLHRIAGLPLPMDKGVLPKGGQQAAAATLTRIRLFNDLLIRFCQHRQIVCPRDLWQMMAQELVVAGAPIAPGSLCAVSGHFAPDNQTLAGRFPALSQTLLPDPPAPAWAEADPTNGYRASHYLTAFAHRIRRNASSVKAITADAATLQKSAVKFRNLVSVTAPDQKADHLFEAVKGNHRKVLASRLRPHNEMGTITEDQPAPPFAPQLHEARKTGRRVIVGCMKNEAPYIVEWIAYHRAIGFDDFLIYTNDCTDGTDAVLGRLQDLGIVQLRNNDAWKGNSPQQYALNQSLREPLIKQAAWIAHIDVDEFINIRTGNGTLDDLFAAVPDATNIAMTWRLFGHNGVTSLSDDMVIDQFDGCAPKFCPKPHTVWGFKTLFRNVGAYGKISCHRPNKLSEEQEGNVKWVSGSGKDITRDLLKNGWRSSTSSIGYDLVQLNHYALRSADSFLIKRQRGRALHVDRSIGINYWIRMDWSECRDVTIKRNIPRVRAEYDRLMQDSTLCRAHDAGLAWHRAKAAELHATPEFADLYRQALQMRLTDTERVAYALSLDTET